MSGSNNDGITEIGDVFTIPGNEKILGVSLGIGRKYLSLPSGNSYISIKVYNIQGNTTVLLAERDTIQLKSLAENAMNFVKFKTAIEPGDTFLVAVNLENLNSRDTLALYQSIRVSTPPDNSFWVKKDKKWISFRDANDFGYSGSLAMSLLACNVGNAKVDTLPLVQTKPVIVWPNPTSGKVRIQSSEDITEGMVSVYNLAGQQLGYFSQQKFPRLLEIDLTGNQSGLYLIRVKNGKDWHYTKILLVSQ